jgi:hypothetical protein
VTFVREDDLKKILIVAAPFGYGPVVKALLIADDLAAIAEVTIFSSRDAYQFVDRYKGSGVCCKEGIFQSEFSTKEDLARFDYFISINHEPAVHYLIEQGLALRTIFVDSILPWRSRNGTVGFAQSILAYLVQDFPDVASNLVACRANTVELIAPMVWQKSRDDVPSRDVSRKVILHVGGVTSPLVRWEKLQKPIEEIVRKTVQSVLHSRASITVIGSRHLSSMAWEQDASVTVLGDVSPPESAALIADADLLITTPGIGAVYEALAVGVPIILLPPMNSTQLLQYGVLTTRGFLGSIDAIPAADLLKKAETFSWDMQTAFVIQWLNRNVDIAISGFVGDIEQMLDTESDGTRRTEVLANQSVFFNSLSNNDAMLAIRRILDLPI